MTPSARRTAALLLAGAVVLTGPAAHARPPHKKALADYLGNHLAARLNDCRTCHLPDPPGGPQEGDDRPHNPFGARLKAVRAELKKAGKKADIPSRIEAVASEDSDGDGVPNLLELLTGHNPGDPNDRPADAELAPGRKTLAAFLQAKSAYPWTPFETVRRPAVPAVKNTAWVRNPIDAFLAAEHEARGLKPRPEAARHVLLRRVYLDLIGLPPTPEELRAALSDPSPDWYEKVVDRLLADPRHGERWGRHWMDVWRYSDWAGYGQQVRDSQPHVWHWRDWIIESLNHDKGYDRMVLEMLAADELCPEDADALRATGFLVRNYKLLSREKWMEDVVEHTGKAFLAVTLNCARCHDHLFDPITQKEYYRVRAIFEPHQVRIDRLPGQPDVKKDGLPRAYDANLTVPTYLFLRGDDRTPDKTPLPPGVPEALGGKPFRVEPVNLPPAAYAPEKREFAVREALAAAAEAATKARQARDAARKAGKPADALTLAELDLELAEARHAALAAVIRAERLEDAGQKDTPEGRQAATEAGVAQRKQAVAEAKRTLHVARQALQNAAAKAKPGLAKKVEAAEKALAKAEADAKAPPTPAYTPRQATPYPKTSTGRRLAFARWLADRDNPLTARVAMNHVWLHHFGQPIVPSVFDFGRNGRPPSHPALLDWLAAEFMAPASGGVDPRRPWSLKHMHRLIVTSSAYRMASTPDDANLALDRDNVYLWRMNSRRLEAEAVRDGVFYVAGRLDGRMGGPDIPHAQGLAVPRRSLYFQHAQEKQMEFLKVFDAAPVTECYRRKESILPQQALALANSDLVRQHAKRLAGELAAKAGADDAAFVTAAFERVLSRPPTAAERAECVAFLKQRPRESLVVVLMNHHEFVTIR
ncbi:MAG TPA: DUF1549 and DUF1553 domain-containing protein [Gemmataceae bacterium]|nr:DUF1549 and DUF1553 domain-containing protein [Gemmataceae bacterium]